jgi:hypothetical protein
LNPEVEGQPGNIEKHRKIPSQKKKKERKKRTERAGEERERERKKGHYQENK